jgi:hypothetical protein
VRARRLAVAAVSAALVGCGGAPDPGPVDSATEKSAEEQLQAESDREAKALERTRSNPPVPSRDND